MEDAELIRNVSDDEVLYAALMRLNCIHDNGGVSCGRALRSSMLEVIINCLFTRNNKYLEGPTKVVFSLANRNILDLLLIEMSMRTLEKDDQLKLFDQLEFVDDRRLAETAAAIMWDWYEKDQKRPDPISFYEYQLAEAIVKMILPLEMPIEPDLAHLVIVMNDDRYYASLKARDMTESHLNFVDEQDI